MKKLVFLSFVSLSVFMPKLHSISVAEYIQQHSTPVASYGTLNLARKGLTDLDGLQDIPSKDQVHTLYLFNNQLQTLPADIFNGFNNLIFLRLENNQLRTVHTNAFNGLYNLKDLALYNNQLEALSAGIFNDLHDLRHLSLRNNQLKELPMDIFSNLDKLESLYLKDNFFKTDFLLSLPNIIHNIPSLERLDNQPIDRALKSYRVYQPKTLQKITKEYAMQNLTPEQIEELAVTGDPVFELLPLTTQQRAAIIAKNIDAFRSRLHELPSEILDLLPLTPVQRAGIAAQKRQVSQK